MPLIRPALLLGQLARRAQAYPRGTVTTTITGCYNRLLQQQQCRLLTSSPAQPAVAAAAVPFTRRIPLALTVPVAALAGGAILYNTNESFRHSCLAVQRVARAAEVVVLCGVDYKYSLGLGNWDLKEDDPEDERERLARRSQLHLRSAVRVREALKANGGIYIKLGQHVASLKYLLPDEWTTSMEPLQDRCIPSSIESIQALFLSDIGQPLSSFFSSFDLDPIGVASLAQVHRATLLDGREVAVKIQHPALDEFSTIDIRTVALLIKLVKWAFPEFEFTWLSEEMQINLPKELNFNFEAANSIRVAENFDRARAEGSPSTIKTPSIVWSKRRVLVMEFMKGARIDDLDYLRQHNIRVSEVSTEMARTFSQMIYQDGFVHCDPHPGNVMIRPTPPGSASHRNFEIILLDHGLYRELTPEFRLDYARLWTAIIASDEDEIQYRARKVGGTEAYQLFSSILTGRDWEVVQEAQLTKRARNRDETMQIKDKAGQLVVDIADILAKVPRDLLLLFKTNDLLRALDEDLGCDDGAQMRTFAIMGRYCALAIYEAERTNMEHELQSQAKSAASVFSVSTVRSLTTIVRSWLAAYCSFVVRRVALDLFVWWSLHEKDHPILRWFASLFGL
ncbi:hypothetical protein DFQ27_002338 [Actinomortierella ambigua]|uniref:ABC1 atypical kinase-like domain-containing protein n=1 Tax=Actinomortierella ambigua TaxID=1343610 RepID=A0A9P6Q7V9_9FUNG|nr:hypothetical protein DFQ27_002338 [Actinomortierella ambigua]